MIWRAVRHITFVELLTWVAYLGVTGLLGFAGVRANGPMQGLLVVLWIALFVVIYRIRYAKR